MNDIKSAVLSVFNENVYKCVLSNPKTADAKYKKVSINRIGSSYQLEKFTKTQVFHENASYNEIISIIEKMLTDCFKQYSSWDGEKESTIRISNKGKIAVSSAVKQALQGAPEKKETHNRAKQYILKEGCVIPPLVDMGIFTADGKVVKSMYDKYKQINRFVELLDDELKRYPAGKRFNVIDFGCGKSYLTFIIYYYLTEIKSFTANVIGLDLKADVIKKCNEAALRYGYSGLKFDLGDINGYECSEPVDLVITLHACDTATDFALYNAVCWNASMIFSVPCCQHELNTQIESDSLSILTRYGIIKERISALMTDAIRANLLTCCGYKTQLLEFIDLSHTPKNLLIRAIRQPVTQASAKKALLEVNSVINEFKLSPTLYRLLSESGRLLG